MERAAAYQAIADVYRETGLSGDYWTAETVAEAERRMALDDADIPDSTAWMLDFALRVLDRLGVVEPFDGSVEHPSCPVRDLPELVTEVADRGALASRAARRERSNRDARPSPARQRVAVRRRSVFED